MVILTFCELKDWVQWYKTSLSWDLRAGSVGSWFSSPSVDFPASFSSAEMGHQLQLVGVTLLGVAMTACEQRGEGRGASAASPASHGLPPAASLPGQLHLPGWGGQRWVRAHRGG